MKRYGSLTSPRAKRISGSKNFRSPFQKDFCNKIGHLPTHSYLSSKTQPGSSNGASVSVASIGCRRLGRVDVRIIRGKFLKSALRNAWTSFKDEGTLEGGAMFLESPDNKGAGVGYRCGDMDGQKTRDLP